MSAMGKNARQIFSRRMYGNRYNGEQDKGVGRRLYAPFMIVTNRHTSVVEVC